jgi:hypothetical protein
LLYVGVVQALEPLPNTAELPERILPRGIKALVLWADADSIDTALVKDQPNLVAFCGGLGIFRHGKNLFSLKKRCILSGDEAYYISIFAWDSAP